MAAPGVGDSSRRTTPEGEQLHTRITEGMTRYHCGDLVGYGLSARIGRKVQEMLRAEGIKVGLIRPITLWPYPKQAIANAAQHAKGFFVLELNAGQMVEDVQLAVNGRCPVEQYGRMGGIIPSPEEVADVARIMYSKL